MTHKQRVLDLLADGRPHTHHELYALHVIGHSRIADLRRDGHMIEQWRDGEDYLYRLVSRVESQSLPSPDGSASCDSTGEVAPSSQPTTTTGGRVQPSRLPSHAGVGCVDGDGQLALIPAENGAYRRAA